MFVLVKNRASKLTDASFFTLQRQDQVCGLLPAKDTGTLQQQQKLKSPKSILQALFTFLLWIAFVQQITQFLFETQFLPTSLINGYWFRKQALMLSFRFPFFMWGICQTQKFLVLIGLFWSWNSYDWSMADFFFFLHYVYYYGTYTILYCLVTDFNVYFFWSEFVQTFLSQIEQILYAEISWVWKHYSNIIFSVLKLTCIYVQLLYLYTWDVSFILN